MFHRGKGKNKIWFSKWYKETKEFCLFATFTKNHQTSSKVSHFLSDSTRFYKNKDNDKV